MSSWAATPLEFAFPLAWGGPEGLYRAATVNVKVELGPLTGLGRTHVSRLERGEATPRLSTIRRIAAALGVEAAALLGEDRT